MENDGGPRFAWLPITISLASAANLGWKGEGVCQTCHGWCQRYSYSFDIEMKEHPISSFEHGQRPTSLCSVAILG